MSFDRVSDHGCVYAVPPHGYVHVEKAFVCDWGLCVCRYVLCGIEIAHPSQPPCLPPPSPTHDIPLHTGCTWARSWAKEALLLSTPARTSKMRPVDWCSRSLMCRTKPTRYVCICGSGGGWKGKECMTHVCAPLPSVRSALFMRYKSAYTYQHNLPPPLTTNPLT